MANRNVRTREFRDLFARLPLDLRELAKSAYRTFLRHPDHPSLRHHALVDMARGRHRVGSRPVSITMKYRAVSAVDGDTNVWYWIGSHNAYESFVAKK